jgi:hypothetical protein
LQGVISDDLLNEFCFESDQDFLAVPRTLKSLGSVSDTRSILSKFIAEQDHAKNMKKIKLMLKKCGIKRISMLGSAMEVQRLLPARPDYHSTPMIWDTGATFGLTSFRGDFIDYVEVEIPVRDVTKINKVVGIGTTMHKMVDTNGKVCYLPCVSYHLPQTDVRLFSPQTYHQLHGSHSEVYGDRVEMILPDHRIIIPIDRNGANLPIVKDCSVSTREKELYGPKLMSALARTGLECLDFFGGIATKEVSRYSPVAKEVSLVEDEYEHYSKFCGPCVGHQDNDNLSGPQKELLLWHWRTGISMFRLQELMREQKMEEPSGRTSILPPVLKPTFKSTPNCVVPACASCQLARAKKRSPGVVRKKPVPEKEAALSRNKIQVGDMVSADQFSCTTPGRLPSGFGREEKHNRFHGGTIYNDAASGIIYVENQVSLGAGETVLGKQRFEEWLYEQAAAVVKHYHSDNGIFTADMFRTDCDKKGQQQTFSGVGAQHQNARAERAIQTIMYMARSYMVHTSLHWSEQGVDDLSLWSFAVQHAVWVYNRIPNRQSGMTPLELLTNIKSDHRDLLRSHVWGCPVFVLDPKLQNDQKLPKWNRRSRLGQFLGFSREHSSMVALVRNLRTGHVSPQYHCVFDDLYQTVFSSKYDVRSAEEICDILFDNARDWYAEEEYEDGKLVYRPPPLHEVWLDESERREKREQIDQQRRRWEEQTKKEVKKLPNYIPDVDDGGPPDEPPPLGIPIVDDDDDDDSLVVPRPSEPEGDDIDFGHDGNDSGNDLVIDEAPAPNIAPEGAPPTTRRRTRGKAKDYGPPKWTRDEDGGPLRRTAYYDHTFSARDISTDPSYPLSSGSRQEPVIARQARLSRKHQKFKQRMRERREIGDAYLNSMTLDDLSDIEKIMGSPLAKYITFAANDCGYSGSAKDLIVNWVHPLFLKAKSAASREDNPTWWEAMSGPFADDYWKAACKEIDTLEGMDAWEVVDRTPDMEVIGSTWAFKLKRFPSGLVKKFKARFCARGDMEKENNFETYCPVVQWTTVRLMLILEVLLGLKSKQGDITAAFLHAEVEEDRNIYVEMPRGFRKPGKVLRLKRWLYGNRESPREFWKYLTRKLENQGLKQSEFDPCLFVGEKVTCIVYVDDLLFWAKDEDDITDLAIKLREEEGVDLEQEDDAAGFLGVTLERDADTGLIEMRQIGLIDRVIAALGLDDGAAKSKFTPAEAKPLVKDEEGEPGSGQFSYSSVVGMLLYLAGHTRPDITYAVNCCARYMFSHKRSHELALKRIGRYLKATRDKGMILNPSKELYKLDAYPDADFCGLFGHEKPTDPTCVKSRTGYVINFADCPVLWQSKLQTETALSTMESEIIALAHCCRELFPIIDITKSLGDAMNLPIGETSMNISIHEDNAGALVLAQTLPPQFTPRSKHYAAKTIWFREEIFKRGIKLCKIDTVEQLGDLFTKGLSRPTFEYLRKKLIGW